MTILKKKRADENASQQPSKKVKIDTADSESNGYIKASDPYIDAENKEIARLEKLMGIKGGKQNKTNLQVVLYILIAL